jgi:hypothetical protein
VLTAIKLLHTVVWALMAGAILTLPLLAWLCAFRWAKFSGWVYKLKIAYYMSVNDLYFSVIPLDKLAVLAYL